MRSKKKDNVKIPSPPSGLEIEEEKAWNVVPLWRETFISKRSYIRRSLLLNWLRINLSAVLVAVLIGRLLYLNTSISVENNALTTLSLGIITASAAILTIIIAFLTFWFGSANDTMQKTRTMIRDEESNIEDIKRQIDPLTARPKDNITGELRDKLNKLAEESETFVKALKILGGRFSRAAIGTYYDQTDLVKINIVIRKSGGDWFVAHRGVFTGHEGHDFCRRIWEKSMDISRNLYTLNSDIMRASNQLRQIINIIPTLISVLFVFIFAIVVAFISSSNTDVFRLAGLLYALILVVLLPVHLVNLVRLLWSLVSIKYFTYEANRNVDLQYSMNIEQRNPLDYEGALKDEAEILIKMYTKEDDNTKYESGN